MAAFDKMCFWYWRDRDESGGMRHAFRVRHGAEDGYLIVGRSECFDSFECLLAIIQARCHAVYAEIGVLDKFGFAPFPALYAVVGFDVAIHCASCKLEGRSDCCLLAYTFADFKANVVPICRAVSEDVDIWSGIAVPMVFTGGGGKGIVGVSWGQMIRCFPKCQNVKMRGGQEGRMG